MLALDDIAEARAVAQAAWGFSLRFELQPYWADCLALLATLEARPRAAARLTGCADAGYATREQDRAPNEASATTRGRALILTALGEVEFERQHAVGGALRDQNVAALAFASEDVLSTLYRVGA